MEDWDWVLQINLYGVIRGVRAFLPHMLERGSGHIVNTASLAGLYAYAWHDIAYVTSKFGVVGLTEALAGLLFTPSAKSMFAFGILVLVLLFRPQGILGRRLT